MSTSKATLDILLYMYIYIGTVLAVQHCYINYDIYIYDSIHIYIYVHDMYVLINIKNLIQHIDDYSEALNNMYMCVWCAISRSRRTTASSWTSMQASVPAASLLL